MFITTPEVSFLIQNLQPTSSFLQIIEGYEDVESVVAVLEAQQSFDLRHNLARYRQDTALPAPDPKEKLKYLGFFLTQHLNSEKTFEVELRFTARYAYTPLVLMLKGFGLRGKKQVHLTQGLILHQEGEINTAGIVRFTFEPLSEWLKDLNRVTGFMVYLLWPKPPKKQQDTALETLISQNNEPESGMIRARSGLNVYRKIDTRV
jgi:hypothetical protein